MTAIKRTALVVDDDLDVRATVVGLLEHLGWTVTELENGENVLRTALMQAPDLIVMDVMMPLKTGFEALKELRQDPMAAQIPVILLTAVNEYELGAQYDAESVGKALGVSYPEGFLEKPVDLKTLEAAVHHVLQTR